MGLIPSHCFRKERTFLPQSQLGCCLREWQKSSLALRKTIGMSMFFAIPDLRNPAANSSGCWRGSWTVSKISALTSAKPPTSSHLTLGILGAPIASDNDDWRISSESSKSCLLSLTPIELSSCSSFQGNQVGVHVSEMDLNSSGQSCNRRLAAAFEAWVNSATKSASTNPAVLLASCSNDTSFPTDAILAKPQSMSHLSRSLGASSVSSWRKQENISEVMSSGEEEVAMTATGQPESSSRLQIQSSTVAAIRGSSPFPSLSFPRAWMFRSSRTQGEQKMAENETGLG